MCVCETLLLLLLMDFIALIDFLLLPPFFFTIEFPFFRWSSKTIIRPKEIRREENEIGKIRKEERRKGEEKATKNSKTKSNATKKRTSIKRTFVRQQINKRGFLFLS